MARCKQCGASGFFLRVNGNGLCPECAERDKEMRLSIMEKGHHRNSDELPKLQETIEELLPSVGITPRLDSDSFEKAFRIFQRAVEAETKLVNISLTAPLAELQEQDQIAENLLFEAKAAISALIEKMKTVSPAEATTCDPADEIMKYKQLLDTGAITQEEYDAKKKQLLNL